MPREENNAGATLLNSYPNGSRTYGNSFWRHPWYIRDCPCTTCGKRHTVRLNQDADTFFSWPGRAWCQGKTRRGFVSFDSDTDGDVFTPYTGG